MSSFMKVDETPLGVSVHLPAGLLTESPAPLPIETHGMGQFRPYRAPSFGIVYNDAPVRQTLGAAGHDLVSQEDVVVAGGASAIVDTGVKVALPMGYYGRIAGRSSLAFKHDVTAFEGTIDSDYRGNIKVKLFNHSVNDYSIHKGDRVAQMIIQTYTAPLWNVMDELSGTGRGEKGFGSSGR